METVHPLPAGERYDKWVGEMARRLPDNAFIVLDDLPQFPAEGALATRLVLLVQAIQGRGVRVLSTSAHSTPRALQEVLGNATVCNACPVFTDPDIVELLISHGAPGTIAQKVASFIGDIGQRHPVLLVAAARYLHAKGWQFTDTEIMDLIGGKHVGPLAGELLNRLVTSVTDESARELLYRLKLITGEFTLEEAQIVAGVVPTIEHSHEKMQSLSGLWIQSGSVDRFAVSPLIKAIPGGNLARDTEAAVHLALGLHAVRNRVLGPWQAAGAIGHFYAAGEDNYGAYLLIEGLRAILKGGEIGDARILVVMWGDMPLPAGIAVFLQVVLRAHQVEARARYGLATDFAVADLGRLIGCVADAQAWALLAVVAVSGPTLARQNPAIIHRAVLRMVQTRESWRGPNGQPLSMPKGMREEALLWMTVGSLRTREQVRGWFDVVRQFSAEGRAHLFNGAQEGGACVILADRLWMIEHEKEAAARNWDEVLVLQR